MSSDKIRPEEERAAGRTRPDDPAAASDRPQREVFRTGGDTERADGANVRAESGTTHRESAATGRGAHERPGGHDDERHDVADGLDAHPLATGSGAAGGAAAGMVAGAAIGGPVGAAIGAAAGAAAGGMAGHGIAEAIDPAEEERHWRSTWHTRDYADKERGYEHYQPAYRYGWESRARHADRAWDDAEADLERDWTRHRGDSALDWHEARPAAHDAWHRLDQRRPQR
jgi:hypothetical protein